MSRHVRPATGSPALTKPLTRRGRRGRTFLKRYLYAQLALRHAAMIALGKEEPLVGFTVEADPPSVYLVYRIRQDALETLPDLLRLPDRLRPTPIRCLADDEPEYLMALNLYRVSGLAKGIRAEWSIFVGDEHDVPRYFVIDARSSETSMDPVDIITRATTVEHERRGETIVSRVGDGAEAFRSTIDLAAEPDAPLVVPSAEWAAANDFIYWGNGICDRTYYDAGMHDSRMRRVGADALDQSDSTPWAAIVEPDPVHVLVFEHAIELVISPWENLGRLG